MRLTSCQDMVPSSFVGAWRGAVWALVDSEKRRGVVVFRLIACGIFAVTFYGEFASTAWADSRSGREDGPRQHSGEFELGAQASMTSGDSCQRTASDVIGCSNGSGRAGTMLGARWRALDVVSIGALGSLLWGSDTKLSTTYVQLGAQLRFLPLKYDTPRWWIGPDAGLAYVLDTLAAGELGPRTTYASTAPVVGLATGIGIPAGDYVEIQFGVRVHAEIFGAANQVSFSRRPDRDTQVGVSLYVSMILLTGDRLR